MAEQNTNDSQAFGLTPDSPQWPALFRSIFSGGLAGLIAGVVFLGVGSRLAMRVVALLNSDARGTLTDADQVVGAITLDGTAVLVTIFGLGGGAFAGVIWVAVREHLPERLPLRMVLAGVIAALVGSFVIIQGSNLDFRLFDPVALNVAMFLLLVGLCGSATAYGDLVLQRRLPIGTRAGVIYGVLVGAGATLALQIVIFFFFVSDAAVHDPPRVAGAFFWVAAVGTLIRWARYTPWRASIPPQAGLWVGTFGLAGMSVFGALYLAGELNEIF